MTVYVRVQDGLVVELVHPLIGLDGKDIPVQDRFTPEFAATLIALKEGEVVNVGDRFDGQSFGPGREVPDDPALVMHQKIALVQAFMDEKARELGYDGIVSAVTYADEPAVPKFQKEGQAFRAWRSMVWDACHEILRIANLDGAPVPSDDDLIAALPLLRLQ